MLRQPVTITLYRRSLKNKTKELGKLIEKERTFRGKPLDWRSHLKAKIVSLLAETGGLTFTKLHKILPNDLRPGSYETLSEVMKELYEEGQIEKEALYPYKWRATPTGSLFQHVGKELEKLEREMWKKVPPGRAFEDVWGVHPPSTLKKIRDMRASEWVKEVQNFLQKMMPSPEERKKYFEDEKKFLKDLKRGAPSFYAAWFKMGADLSDLTKWLLITCNVEQARAERKLSPERIEQLCRIAEAQAAEKVKGLVSGIVRKALEESARK